MTSLVGIVCSDGIVIGTDSSATYGSIISPTIEQEFTKIKIYNGIVIVTGTGEIGLQQRFCNIVDKAFRDANFTKGKSHIEIMTALSQKAIDNFKSTYTPFPQFQHLGYNFGSLVALSTGDKYCLCEFDPIHFRPELKLSQQKLIFCSMGCGVHITDPFLGLMRKIFWKTSIPSVAEAKFIVAWTLKHAIDLNPGGIKDPIQMAAIRKNEKGRYSAVMISDDETKEHWNAVDDAEKYLGRYRDILRGTHDVKKIPDVTPP